MKNKLIYVALAAVLIVCTVTGCTAQTANKETNTVTDTVSEKSETVTDGASTSAVSSEGISTAEEDNQASDEKNESERKEETTTTKNSTSNSSKNSKTTHGNISTTTKKSSSAKETTTKRQTTTQKQTTTKKPTTTRKPTTTKKSGLSKSDVEWVQSQAHAYIKSKGISVDSSVQSFSYRTSSHNYTSKNDLLNTIKETIDYEYSECMSSGWNKVSMYVSISSDGNGDYWLIVKYG